MTACGTTRTGGNVRFRWSRREGYPLPEEDIRYREGATPGGSRL
jgi:hypothetical protein